ncbi:MAG: SIMPL domain-containing protein [Bacteroidota bacterium]
MNNKLSPFVIALSIIVSAFVLGRAWNYRYRAQETISVTGLASKDFSSDLVVWSGNYSRKSLELRSAYSQLKADENSIREYLVGKGISSGEIVFSSVGIDKQFSYTYDENGRQTGQQFTGYNLTQTITVESKDIDKVESVSRQVTELIEQGIEFYSGQPSYFYTKLADLKLDLLANASSDARRRAEIIAENSGSSLGDLKKSAMGVFQITGQNSNEDYSYGGVFNTSSRQKTASITLRVEYQAN